MPEIVFADEPTGNLDSKTTKEVMELITKMAGANNQTLVIVTHDLQIASYADRIVHILDGNIEKIDIINARGFLMRKLTIVLAVLMLFLQVFSCTVAYGSDGFIRIMACEPATNSPIHKDDVVEMGLVIKNETDKDMTDIEIIIKEASFSGWTS